MPNSFGKRARTRDLFCRPFRGSGPEHLSTYLTTYKLGDYVDIKANGSIHKGMPHKFYHGKTGVVWNISKRAIGVEVSKKVGNRILRKRVHVRVEHVQKSRCREDFLNRVKENQRLRQEAKEAGISERISLKRTPILPKPGKTAKVKLTELETVTPIRYEFIA